MKKGAHRNWRAPFCCGYEGLWLFLEQSEDFTDPEDYGGAADDDYPVDEYEDGEEQGEFVAGQGVFGSHYCCAYLGQTGDVGVFKVVEQSEQEEEENTSHTDD